MIPMPNVAEGGVRRMSFDESEVKIGSFGQQLPRIAGHF
jgi:hypothetical protein